MASRSLGPFPKSYNWLPLLAASGVSTLVADKLLEQLQAEYETLTHDPDALRAITFLVALPIATRSGDAVATLEREFGIMTEDFTTAKLLKALDRHIPWECLPKSAAGNTICGIACQSSLNPTLFQSDPKSVWREHDGPAFCDLAREYFSNLNLLYFSHILASANIDIDRQTLRTFAEEMAYITRTFSARWFNACARYRIPETGSIHWYLGHCLGKLDLEISREKSDWIEPAGNPWRRRKLLPDPALYDDAYDGMMK